MAGAPGQSSLRVETEAWPLSDRLVHASQCGTLSGGLRVVTSDVGIIRTDLRAWSRAQVLLSALKGGGTVWPLP